MNLTKNLLDLANFDPIKLNYYNSLSIADFYEHMAILQTETAKKRANSGKGAND